MDPEGASLRVVVQRAEAAGVRTMHSLESAAPILWTSAIANRNAQQSRFTAKY
jgi:hypothetical protein